jgi:hypothetical protein
MKDLKDYNFGFLGYGTVESGTEVPAFWRNRLSPYSFHFHTDGGKAMSSSEMLLPIYLTTWHHIQQN